MQTAASKKHDVLICGAGPTGLSAAIFCARSGLDVLVCEKGTRPGPEPRGETVRDDPILSELLGYGFLDKIASHKTALRRFHSPGAKKILEIERSTPSFVFEWEQLLARLEAQAIGAGVRIVYGQEIVAPILEKGVCTGARAADGTVYQAPTVLACGGRKSILGKNSGVDYSTLNCPIVKSVVSGYRGTFPGFVFFFVAQGELAYAPHFPPAVIFVFPRGRGQCETGVMVFSRAARRLRKACRIPDDAELLEVWQRLKDSYPGFSDLIDGTTVEYEAATAIPVAGKHQEAMPVPGLILVGDSMGFVEANGASGLLSGMKGAHFVADYLVRRRNRGWNQEEKGAFNRAFQASSISRHIEKRYFLVLSFLDFLFAGLRTSERINRFWWLVRTFYKLG